VIVRSIEYIIIISEQCLFILDKFKNRQKFIKDMKVLDNQDINHSKCISSVNAELNSHYNS